MLNNYCKILSKYYDNIAKVSKEIINLEAILNLPKSTEHFITDIHGEYESFSHILRNASGYIRMKIDEEFSDLMLQEKKDLATLVYYPKEWLKAKAKHRDQKNWYKVTLERLVILCKVVSSKYSRSKVRKALPENYSYIIEELLHENSYNNIDRKQYYNGILESIIELNRADDFIVELSKVIRRLAVDHLHIVGDIYDRGPAPHLVMDELMNHHSLDIQWGNHDILWAGAAAGSTACIYNVLRICMKYNNLESVEDGYGINLLPLARFAMKTYKNTNCKIFEPKINNDENISLDDIKLIAQMHKAVTVIQLKLEGKIIKESPEYNMDDRLFLDKIDFSKKTVRIDGKDYHMLDTDFPTFDTVDPYKLNKEEEELTEKLKNSFQKSEKLQKHVKFLILKGGIYLKYNSNLLYHACIPMEENKEFKKIEIFGKFYYGKNFLDKIDMLIREYYLTENKPKKKFGSDFFWYLWCHKDSPLFGKDKMATFERYFIADKLTHKEIENPYFVHRDKEKVCNMILENFDLDITKSHIINGHMPVIVRKGESPIKANGKLLVIDGGLSKAYQKKTGIAGYTLIYNSYGLLLTTHGPFISTQEAIESGHDILTISEVVRKSDRKFVKDTDIGMEISEEISELKYLLTSYKEGIIKEKNI
ncbi:Fructose-1,6-bisphosphatase class 3 [Sebaldella termitidis]|uniref:Fructose-1,6-bisphosphatase class 3 n=1 Tax=Sebaldella termitidis (strain ATCC 33386 / NCTC 11300) TaxID=526218 RepID=D1AJJ0_SEBTE|nr:fructose-bisphosphatase class III [Sebaldella termitidis]ACZ08878.1 fructose-16-bisphosphatase [Sebaldella termitidis ATCC 33386]SUI24198.1 Fructose-1,6-bisphosphatase class 3 [Sebaldella termitidis]